MDRATRPPERWHRTIGGTDHVVTVEDRGLRRHISWHVDQTQVASKATGEDRVVLYAAGHGAVAVRLPSFLGPARRVTWHDADSAASAAAAAWTGVGGEDLVPQAGSRAAARQEWLSAHPRLFTARQTAFAIAAVVVPLVCAWLLARIAIPWPAIPWPDIDLPDLPWIPWPDLPRIPWPDWSVPDWLRAVLEKAKYVWPVLVAFLAARAEIRRRRRLEQQRRRRDGDLETE